MDTTELQELVTDYFRFHRTKNPGFKTAVERITAMTFLSGPEDQWRMILEALRQADNDDELGMIAAGPIEGFLGKHGQAYVERVERQASTDTKFARALTGVWKYTIADDVWARIQVLQGRVPDPLSGSGNSRS